MAVTELRINNDRQVRAPRLTGDLESAKNNRYIIRIACEIVLLASDIFAICVAGLGALFFTSLFRALDIEGDTSSISLSQLMSTAPALSVVAALVLSYMILHGHYTRRLPFWIESREIVEIGLFAIFSTGIIELSLQGKTLWHLSVTMWGLFVGASIGTRWITRHLLALGGLWQIKVLMIADRSAIDDPGRVLKSERLLGYEVVGILTTDDINFAREDLYFGNLLKAYGATRLILAIDTSTKAGTRIMRDVARERVAFSLMSKFPGIPVGLEQVAFFSHDLIMLSYRNKLAHPVARTTKMALDLFVASLLLIILSPPMAIIALFIRFDGGPALFGHERIGGRGRTFKCLKFRTMRVDADEFLQKHLANDPIARAEWAETQKLTRDPRVTSIGRFLRASSLDELPQLFNVLRLEMSLVGPRPIVQQEIDRYDEDIAYYYGMKPGLTGLWQVSGRSDTSYKMRVSLDGWYVRNWSIWHDITIILKTIPVVVRRNGAR